MREGRGNGTGASYNLPYLNTQWRKRRKGSEGEEEEEEGERGGGGRGGRGARGRIRKDITLFHDGNYDMRWERMELNPHHGIQRQSLLRVLQSSHLSLTRSLKLFIVMCLTSLPGLCQLSSLVVQKLLGELSPVPRLQHSRM